MAEEKHLKPFDENATDDMSVMRVLMHTVKGLSPISAASVLDFAESE